MPKVGLARENNRLEVRAPTALENPRAARVRGENIAAFGQDVVQTASNLQTFFKARKTAKDRVELDRIRLSAIEQAQNLDREARNKYGNDPDKMIEFYDTQYQKNTDALYKGLGPDIAGEAENVIKGVRLQTRDSLNNYALKRSVELVAEDSEALINQTSQLVFNDPKLFDTQRLEMRNNLEVLRNTGVYDDATFIKHTRDVDQKLVYSAVMGLANQKQFHKAREETTRLGAYIGAENMKKLTSEINNMQSAYVNQQLALENYEERQANKRLEALGKANGQFIMTAVTQAATVQDREKALETLAEMEATGAPIDASYKRAITALATREQTQDDSKFEVEILEDLTSGKANLASTRKKILEGIAEGKVSNAKAPQLLRMVMERQRAKSTRDPSDVARFNAKLDAYYPKSGVLYQTNPTSVLGPRAQLMDKTYDLANRKGIPLHEAIDIVGAQELADPVGTLPYAEGIPATHQMSVSGIAKGVKTLKEMRDRKMITESEYRRNMEILMQREEALNKRKDVKEAVKGKPNAEGQ